MDTALRRKDTTKGPPLRVLSLDGGGVRGYSMLILLQELMHKAYTETEGKPPKKEDIPKPCDYFDLIAGTGTGGLIAIMLGRLRLDLETSKQVYARMTRKVFETDKTIAGIPYRSTLFKASKLEEAIKECVREHTIDDSEGNDGTVKGGRPEPTPMNNVSNKRLSRTSSIGSSLSIGGHSRMSPTKAFSPTWRYGNADASMYDSRENRTKTAVTAAYKGTRKNEHVILLRSYDSRKEPPPEFNCTIWQAGRATSATGLAFKPIQIGQSVFMDEGAMNYNPAPQILDEAVCNEWPGRELGVFVSIGTGKRPPGTDAQQHLWWEDFSGLGQYAEAKRRLVAKTEGCEDTHQLMLSDHLAKRGVPRDNYYRLNVEVGVGEFGMNEWTRLAEISTNTRRYLAKPEVKRMNDEAAAKLARIERTKRRHASTSAQGGHAQRRAQQYYSTPLEELPIELPGDNGHAYQDLLGNGNPHYSQYSAPDDKFAVLSPSSPPLSTTASHFSNQNEERFSVLSPHDIPQSARRSGDAQRWPENGGVSDVSGYSSNVPSSVPSPRRSHESGVRMEPPPLPSRSAARGEAPPLPPKTPLVGGEQGNPPLGQSQLPQRMGNGDFMIQPLRPHSHHGSFGGQGQSPLPYPDDDGPPPVVNMSRKPQNVGR